MVTFTFMFAFKFMFMFTFAFMFEFCNGYNKKIQDMNMGICRISAEIDTGTYIDKVTDMDTLYEQIYRTT
jgi:hypothetical protein